MQVAHTKPTSRTPSSRAAVLPLAIGCDQVGSCLPGLYIAQVGSAISSEPDQADPSLDRALPNYPKFQENNPRLSTTAARYILLRAWASLLRTLQLSRGT